MTICTLDCTLRDGAYINNAEFGKPAMRGIISKLQDAHVEIIECGWLKIRIIKKELHTSMFLRMLCLTLIRKMIRSYIVR